MEKKFYFDNSWINAVYDLYDLYKEEIYTYQQNFSNDKIVNSIKRIYDLARQGYVLGESIDQFLIEYIRQELGSKGIEDKIDPYYLRYLKARIFTDKDARWAAIHTGRYTGSNFSEMCNKLINDPRIISLKVKIKDARTDLEDEVLKLKSLRVRLA